MKHCINIKSPAFQALVEESKLHPAVLSSKMGVWMDEHNSDEWPTLDQLDGGISYVLKAADILLSDKAEQVFAKGNKNSWSLDKILTELAIPKEQKQLLLDLEIADRDQLAIELQSRYGYNIDLRNRTIEQGVSVEDELEARMMGQRRGFTGRAGFYSNMASPGGTNYQEWEISTPDITPSIKGHAQFATDKGIGWARVDEKAYAKGKGMYDYVGITSEDAPYMIEATDDFKEGLTDGKTLRILELQSDLFQKGRDKSDLVTPHPELDPAFRTENFDTMDEHQEYLKTVGMNDNSSSQNKFLQLLNKDGNWITFFVKSLLQHATKEGYEKVLFPRGETAAKIEGHQALADEIKKLNNEITKLEDSKSNLKEYKIENTSIYVNGVTIMNLHKSDGFLKDGAAIWTSSIKDLENKDIVSNDTTTNVHGVPFTYVNGFNNDSFKKTITVDDQIIRIDSEIKSLEVEKQNYKDQGIEKLKPIEAFYEIKVKNILDKQFGKESVKEVVDEYGNGWYEIDLSNSKVQDQTKTISLKLQELPNIPLQKDPLRYKFYKLLDNKNQIRSFQNDAAARARLAELREEYKGEQTFALSKNGKHQIFLTGKLSEPKNVSDEYKWWGNLNKDERAAERLRIEQESKDDELDSRIGLQKTMYDFLLGDESSSISSSASKSFSSSVRSLFNAVNQLGSNSKKPLSKEAKAIIYTLAKNISGRTNIEFDVSDSKTIKNLFPNIEGEYKGLFSPYENKAYLIDDHIDGSTPVHEIFSHPFINYIKSNETTKHIYDRLLEEAKLIPGLQERIYEEYHKSSPEKKDEELVAAAIDMYVDKILKNENILKEDKGIISAIKGYIKEFAKFVSNILGIKKEDSYLITPKSTLEDLAKWAVYGENKMNLVLDPVTKLDILKAIAEMNHNNRDSFEGMSNGNNTIDQYVNKFNFSDKVSSIIKDWISEKNPGTIGDMIAGVMADLNNEKIQLNTREDLLLKRAVTVPKPSIENVNKIQKEIIHGLNSRINVLGRSKNKSKAELDELKKLVENVTRANSIDAAVKFIEYANDKAIDISAELNSMNELRKSEGEIDKERLMSIQKDFLEMFSKSLNDIDRLLDEDLFDLLPSSSSYAQFRKELKAVNDEFVAMDKTFDKVIRYTYEQEFAKEATISGSTTAQLLLDTGIFTSEKDVTSMSLYLGGASKSRIEMIRALDIMIQKAKVDAYKEVSDSGYVNRLISLAKNRTGAKGYMSHMFMYETDKDGKYTGYAISPLKYGEHIRNRTKFMSSLYKKYGIKEYSVPILDADRIAFNKEKNDYDTIHSERMFKPEYYVLRNSLSAYASEQIDDANSTIRRIKDKYRNENGRFTTERMTIEDIEALNTAEKDKQSLSSDYSTDGITPKFGLDLDTAKEIREFNKKLAGKLEYTPNMSEFNEGLAWAKANLTAEEYSRWAKLNVRTFYKQEFWDQMSKIDKADQSPEWQALYDQKQAILKRYRNNNTMEIDVNKMEATRAKGTDKNVREFLDEINTTLERYKSESTDKKGISFSSIAEMVLSDEYKEKSRRMNDAFLGSAIERSMADKWFNDNHTVGRDGVTMTPKSYWLKIIPKDRELVVSNQPSNLWNDLNKGSEYYNNNFREELSEFGMQPKASLYDNKKEYNKIMSDPDKKAFYDEVLKMKKEADSMYDYMDRPNPLRLPQIEGNSLRKIFKSDNYLKGLWNVLGDAFIVKQDDTEYGGTDIDKNQRPNGDPIKYIPTFFVKPLENPNTISKDLIHMMTMYYSAATNYKHMTKALPKFQVMQEGLDKTTVNNAGFLKNITDKLNMTKAGSTYMSKRAEGLINRGVYGETSSRMTVNVPWTDKKIDIAKPVKTLITYFKMIALANNPITIFANWASSEEALLVESEVGLNLNRKDYAWASMEVAKRLPKMLMSPFTASVDDKVLSMLIYFDISQSNLSRSKGTYGFQPVQFAREHWAYGPYTAGDMIVKSKLLLGMMKGFKVHNGEFVNRDQFITSNYPTDRKTGTLMFNALKDTMFDAFEMKNGQLNVKPEFKDAYTNEFHSKFTISVNRLASNFDGVLTPTDRNQIDVNAFASSLMMFRGWLVSAFQERLGSEMYSYEHQMVVNGQYRDGFSTGFKILIDFMSRVVDAAKTGTFEKESIANSLSSSKIRNYKKTMNELKYMVIMGLITAVLAPSGDGDDGDDPESVQYQAYVLALRVFMEMNSLYSPVDTWGLLKTPTAAMTPLSVATDYAQKLITGKAGDIVDRGRYEGFNETQKALIKLSPLKNPYEKIINPDLKAQARYIKDNTLPYMVFEAAFGKDKESLDEKKRSAAGRHH